MSITALGQWMTRLSAIVASAFPLVVRSVTTITALRMISYGWNAPGATAKMLSMMAETLPNGAQLDLIVSTPVVLQALGCCTDIISHNWYIDTYCQDPEWKEVMAQ
jgi:hypothetical protein